MRPLRPFIMRYGPLVVLSLLIFLASAQEQAPMPDLGFTWQDKVYHFFAYMAYAVTVYRAVSGTSVSTRGIIVRVLVITAVYAASDEWHQSFVPGRSSEVQDWIADVSGAVVVSLFIGHEARVKERGGRGE